MLYAYPGSLLKHIQLSSHSVHSPSQTHKRLPIPTQLLSSEQLLELVQPVLLIQLLTGQQLVEAAHAVALAFFLAGEKVLELAHRVSLAGQ